MSRKKPKAKRQHIESYEHRDKQRVNNPPVGLVTPNTDPDTGAKKAYTYDPHLDPQLQWAGKAEHTSFEVPNVSLHVHDRIDPRTIVEAVRKRNGNGDGNQLPLFEQEREIPLRQEIEFYQHSHNWTNRLVAGDSLLVMNSLLQKENIGGGGGGGVVRGFSAFTWTRPTASNTAAIFSHLSISVMSKTVKMKT